MNKPEAQEVGRVLDELALELVNHNHHWSKSYAGMLVTASDQAAA